MAEAVAPRGVFDLGLHVLSRLVLAPDGTPVGKGSTGPAAPAAPAAPGGMGSPAAPQPPAPAAQARKAEAIGVDLARLWDEAALAHLDFYDGLKAPA